MAENTKIEWADHTWSPVWGCTQVSKAETGGGGCDNCYAQALAHRFGYGWNGSPMREFGDHHWNEPVRWNKRAAANGMRPTVFPSMCDPLDKDWPAPVRERFWRLVDATPYLTWLILTKRIGNADRLGPGAVIGRWPANVWLGATVVNQAETDRDIPKLLATPARVRFLSMEPLLGPVNLSLPNRLFMNSGGVSMCNHCCNGDRCDDPTHHDRGRPDWSVHCPYCRGTGRGKPIDWVIVGGESGPGARPMHPDWARSLRDQCAAAGVPFMFKQWGEWHPAMGDASQPRLAVCKHGSGSFEIEAGARARSFDLLDRSQMHRVGKKAAGRLLDGVEHNGFPEIQP